MIIQNISQAALTDLSFTVPRADLKKAVPHELALDILKKESESGQLDRELFRIFVEAGPGVRRIRRIARGRQVAWSGQVRSAAGRSR